VRRRFTWFVYPEGEPRPATASRLDLEYWPTPLNSVYFSQDRGGFPVQGRKYNVEMDFTLFETDNPPPESENVPRNTWRPEDGKNYRVLLQRTLTQTAQ